MVEIVEILVAVFQALCIVGLLCGAYFAITYGEAAREAPTPSERFDPVTTHSWNVGTRAFRHARD